MKNIFFAGLAACAALFAAVGCTADRSAEPKDLSKFENMPKRVTQKVLPKVPTGDFELKIPYDITAQSGTSLELNVQLLYHGRKQQEIKEWYMLDQYNFEIYYRSKTPGVISGKENKPFKVYRLKPPKGSDPRRSGLIFNSGNRALLTINLPFVGDLNPGEKALFEVYIQTALRTFKLRSNRMLIRAR